MTPMEVLKELRTVQEKYKNATTHTFEVRISDMAKDAADAIDSLQQENKNWIKEINKQGEMLRLQGIELTNTQKVLEQAKKILQWMNEGNSFDSNAERNGFYKAIDEAIEAIDKVYDNSDACCSCGKRPATVGNDDGQYCEACAEDLEPEEIIDLLNYHNPMDLKVLKQAREILASRKCQTVIDKCSICSVCPTIEAIDKVLGVGK
jgi:hypothetical protein